VYVRMIVCVFRGKTGEQGKIVEPVVVLQVYPGAHRAEDRGLCAWGLVNNMLLWCYCDVTVMLL
jgi:hypothetical protein